MKTPGFCDNKSTTSAKRPSIRGRLLQHFVPVASKSPKDSPACKTPTKFQPCGFRRSHSSLRFDSKRELGGDGLKAMTSDGWHAR